MKNFSTGSGGALKSPFNSRGTTGPAIPSSNTMVSIKRAMDPASSYVPHKCPDPIFENRARQRT
jgi:hypothetical protein